MKDIGTYIDFSNGGGRYPKRSVRSLLNQQMVIHDWTELESRYKDGNPSGRYLQLHVETQEGHFLVNTGSLIIMEQLEQVKAMQERDGETDTAVACMARRSGRGVKLYPVDWERRDAPDDGSQK